MADRHAALAGGVRFIDHLVDAAIPHMSRFTREQGWPLHLATLSAGGPGGIPGVSQPKEFRSKAREAAEGSERPKAPGTDPLPRLQ